LPRLRGSDQARVLAQGLGWFSIGLGLVQALAPHRVTHAVGIDGQERLMSHYGVREIVTGIGLLAARDPVPWLWGRVGGDVLDAGTLAAGLAGRDRERSGVALLATLGVLALDYACIQALRRPSRAALAAYRKRSGLPRPPGAMRGAAQDFEVPADMRTPELLRPWGGSRS
jgi:hypothetical protein